MPKIPPSALAGISITEISRTNNDIKNSHYVFKTEIQVGIFNRQHRNSRSISSPNFGLKIQNTSLRFKIRDPSFRLQILYSKFKTKFRAKIKIKLSVSNPRRNF